MTRRIQDDYGDWWRVGEGGDGAAAGERGRRPSAGPYIEFVREADEFRIWTPTNRLASEMDDGALRELLDECRRRYPSE